MNCLEAEIKTVALIQTVRISKILSPLNSWRVRRSLWAYVVSPSSECLL